MIQEAYVFFETAKLLKEKGFNEPTLAYAYGNGMMGYYSRPRITDPLSIEAGKIPMPTLQMAMKWLLKKYNIFICVLFLEESGGYGYTIEDIIKKKYIATSKNSSYEEPEKASEAAIKYCLENLNLI